MTTVLLLLPVFAILAWLYWYLLPQRTWKVADTFIMISVLAVAGGFIWVIAHQEFAWSGSLWPQIVSVTGAYAILTLGLAVGLGWRRRMHS